MTEQRMTAGWRDCPRCSAVKLASFGDIQVCGKCGYTDELRAVEAERDEIREHLNFMYESAVRQANRAEAERDAAVKALEDVLESLLGGKLHQLTKRRELAHRVAGVLAQLAAEGRA
jgi:ribosomal protein S27AE